MYIEPDQASGELVPQIFIETMEFGSYFIPRHRLVALSPDEAERAELAVLKLIEDHPLFDFTSQEDLYDYGIRICWRKRK